MRRVFTSTADFTPYTARPNNIPLTYGLRGDGADRLREAGGAKKAVSAPRIPDSKRDTFKQWRKWSEHQRFTGRRAAPDFANLAQLNRVIDTESHTTRLRHDPS